MQAAAEGEGEGDVVVLLAAFRSLAAARDAECRGLCAVALPKVLRGATPRRCPDAPLHLLSQTPAREPSPGFTLQ